MGDVQTIAGGFISLLPKPYQALTAAPSLEAAISLGPRLREADLLEVKAASGLDGTGALISSARSSALSWVFMHPQTGLPHAMAGLGIKDGLYVPWLLSAPFDKAMRRFLAIAAPLALAYMHSLSPRLENYVDSRHHEAIAWLKRLGFEFAPAPITWGVEQIPFYYFWRIKECANQLPSWPLPAWP
jgi:hypothetical protein